MSRVGEFLNLYNQLDEHMRRILGVDRQMSHARLLDAMAERDALFEKLHSRLQAFRALRNSIVHISTENGTEPIAEPMNSVLDDYRMLVQYLKNPPAALDSIATIDIFSVTWSTEIKSGLDLILGAGYDTIPILEQGCLEGIYTFHCLQLAAFSRIALRASFHLSADATFAELKDYCAFSAEDLTNSRNTLRLVKLMARDARIEDVEALFRAEAARNHFLAAVCTTSSGRAFEPLLGLITPHNLPSANASAEYIQVLRRRLA
ncbi:MAG TPA: hypothetical protein PLD73_18650 [Candidatus Hydrogenedentes bacterium]|nr:hypothetical protein [Candidatus Hydrogenedentota bacterium]